MRFRWLGYFAALFVMVVCLPCWVPANAQQIAESVISPDPAAAAYRPPTALSTVEMERLFMLKERIRERFAEGAIARPGPTPLPDPQVAATEAIDFATQYPGPVNTFKIGRNNKNTNANNASKGSTLAEPAAGNEGARVLAAGNYNHAEYSTNGGTTWTDIVLPGGPADAPTLCCDNEIVYDQPRGLWILSSLYINSSATNGAVRLFVFRTLPTYSCSYTIDQAGADDNILMDFPHIAVSNKYLYLSSNDIPTSGNQNARMRRLDLDAMADCLTASISTYAWPSTTEGQRVWRPIQGATDTMYFAHHATTTSFRIFSWPETAASPTNSTRTLAASTFSNPDCRGGTGNYDWTDSLWSNITGFNLNGAVGRDYVAWYWNVGVDASHTQGHSHGAVLTKPGLTLTAQPVIWSSTACFGQTTIAMNERGDIGYSLSYGGKSGGSGTAAQGYIGMDDEYTSGLGQPGSVSLIASGTHNRSDQRHGDYFTVHQMEPCDMWFSATNYALSGGTGVANVNSRYVEFGRGRDEKCWLRWKDTLGTP